MSKVNPTKYDEPFYKLYDPQYVQISKTMFALIIGRSNSGLDKLRESDPRCPRGERTGKSQRSPVLFLLSDVYAYSKLLMEEQRKITDELEADKKAA